MLTILIMKMIMGMIMVMEILKEETSTTKKTQEITQEILTFLFQIMEITKKGFSQKDRTEKLVNNLSMLFNRKKQIL